MDRHELKLTRCDRCGAETKRTYTKGGQELKFCQHHANQFHDGLIMQGFEEVKTTEDRITELEKALA